MAPLPLPALTAHPCAAAPSAPGVHLYHSGVSSCSQHVRLALHELGVAYVSHHVVLPANQHLDPHYAKINPRLVVPCVAEAGAVTTDSENVMRFLDANKGTGALFPPVAERFVKLLSDVPVFQLTYCTRPAGQETRSVMMERGANEDAIKASVAELERLLEKHAADDALATAFRAALEVKRAKLEQLSAAHLLRALGQTDAALDEVAAQLASGPFSSGGYLCSDSFTAADILLGVLLHRLEALGLGPRLIAPREGLKEYLARVKSRPSWKAAVTAWDNPLYTVFTLVLAKLGLASWK